MSCSRSASTPVRIEELRINSGNNFDANTWNEFGRARKLVIKSGKQSQAITIEDVRGAQPVQLNPPMLGSRFTIEILDQYPAEDPDASVCVTDIVFVSEGKPLNGPWLTTKLKYDKATAQANAREARRSGMVRQRVKNGAQRAREAVRWRRDEAILRQFAHADNAPPGPALSIAYQFRENERPCSAIFPSGHDARMTCRWRVATPSAP